MMTVALIDLDMLAYRHCAAVEYVRYTLWDAEGEEVVIRGKRKSEAFLAENEGSELVNIEDIVEPIEYVLHNINLALALIETQVRTKELRGFLGIKDNVTFRHLLDENYKANRVDKAKPTHLYDVHDWLQKQIRTEYVSGIEADDALGIALHTRKDGVICSGDKDLLQIPGKHYNIINGKKLVVGELAGNFRLFTQVLVGDATDNIKGVPRVGPKTAVKLLEDCKTVEDMVGVTRAAYAKAYKEEGDREFLATSKLVYILREPNDSFEKYLERNKVEL